MASATKPEEKRHQCQRKVFKPNALSPCRRNVIKKPYAKKGRVLSRIGGERESQDSRASISRWLQKAEAHMPEEAPNYGHGVRDEADAMSRGGAAEQPLLKEPEIIVESVAGSV